MQDAKQQEEEEREQRHRADEAQLLAQHGEDEVAVGDAQVAELGLGSLQEALAPHPTRSDADLRLQNVVTLVQRVCLWVEENQDSLAHVVFKTQPDDGKGDRRDAAKDE